MLQVRSWKKQMPNLLTDSDGDDGKVTLAGVEALSIMLRDVQEVENIYKLDDQAIAEKIKAMWSKIVDPTAMAEVRVILLRLLKLAIRDDRLSVAEMILGEIVTATNIRFIACRSTEAVDLLVKVHTDVCRSLNMSARAEIDGLMGMIVYGVQNAKIANHLFDILVSHPHFGLVTNYKSLLKMCLKFVTADRILKIRDRIYANVDVATLEFELSSATMGTNVEGFDCMYDPKRIRPGRFLERTINGDLTNPRMLAGVILRAQRIHRCLDVEWTVRSRSSL